MGNLTQKLCCLGASEPPEELKILDSSGCQVFQHYLAFMEKNQQSNFHLVDCIFHYSKTHGPQETTINNLYFTLFYLSQLTNDFLYISHISYLNENSIIALLSHYNFEEPSKIQLKRCFTDTKSFADIFQSFPHLPDFKISRHLKSSETHKKIIEMCKILKRKLSTLGDIITRTSKASNDQLQPNLTTIYDHILTERLKGFNL
jgi:hypothetical protein